MVKLPNVEGYMYYYQKWTISSQNFSSSRRDGLGGFLSHQASIGGISRARRAAFGTVLKFLSRSIALKKPESRDDAALVSLIMNTRL